MPYGKAAFLFSGIRRPEQADVVYENLARAAWDCHIATSTKTYRDSVNVGQVYALI